MLGALAFVLGALPSCSAQDRAGPATVLDGSMSDATGSSGDASGPGDGASPIEAASDAAGGDAGAGAADAAGDANDAAVGDGGCQIGPAGEAIDLRCAGLYSDWAAKTVAPGAIEYDPGLHLWSDGAVKTRWIDLPSDGSADGGRIPIDTSDMDEWTFPVGTKFWKEFVLGGRRIETRLLWKQTTSTWYRTTYQWAADESSATEQTGGALDADGNGYEIPTQGACDTCHNGRMDGVLGFEAVSLSSPGATPLTLGRLATLRWITDAPDAALVIPGNAVDVAALGYLHANCGISCHNAGWGQANSTGFHMRLDVATLATVQATDTWTTGVNQPTRFFEEPGQLATLRFAPYDAGASCAYYRPSHRDGLDGTAGGTQMPPVDTHKVDEAGVALIAQWIGQGCQ